MGTIQPSREIGQRMKEVRRVAGDLQAATAAKLGITVSHYSKIESGHNQFSERILMDFCRVYGCPAEWIRSGRGAAALRREGAPGQPAGAHAAPGGAYHGPPLAPCVDRVIEITMQPDTQEKAKEIARILGCDLKAALSIVVQHKLAPAKEPSHG